MVNIIQEIISLHCLIHSIIHSLIHRFSDLKGTHQKKAKRPNGSSIFYVDERGIYLKNYTMDDESRPSGQSIALWSL